MLVARSAAVLEDGRLYTWGASDFGKLGHGRAREAQLLPRVVVALEGHRVVQVRPASQRATYHRRLSRCVCAQVSLGMSHSACVTDGGHVYTWGGGWLGRLGLGSTANHSTPQRVEALRERKCVQASCGAFHTMAVTDDGDVYVWGRGDERLGIGETRDLLDPLLLPLVRQDKVRQRCCRRCRRCRRCRLAAAASAARPPLRLPTHPAARRDAHSCTWCAWRRQRSTRCS